MQVASNSSHALELLKQLDQNLSHSSQGDKQAFNRALAMEQGINAHKPTTIPSYGPEGKPNANANQNFSQSLGSNSQGSTSQAPTNSNLANSPANTGTVASSSGSSAAFNASGNLSATTNLNDFKLLNQQNVLMQQVLSMSKTISATQASALQPSVMISLGMLQKLYEMIELRTRNRNTSLMMASNPNQAAQNADDLAASAQAQILSFVMVERFLKMFENGEKYNILSRFFKKGPLGENEHDTNTDDEYGNSYADVDAEIDYIKRPRRDKPGMSFHHSMLS